MNENTGGIIALVAVIAIVGYLIYSATKKPADTQSPIAAQLQMSPGESVGGDIVNGANAVMCQIFGIDCDEPVY